MKKMIATRRVDKALRSRRMSIFYQGTSDRKLAASNSLSRYKFMSILNLWRLRKALSALPMPIIACATMPFAVPELTKGLDGPIPEQSVIPTVSLKWQKVMADGVLVGAVDAKAEAHRRPFFCLLWRRA